MIKKHLRNRRISVWKYRKLIDFESGVLWIFDCNFFNYVIITLLYASGNNVQKTGKLPSDCRSLTDCNLLRIFLNNAVFFLLLGIIPEEFDWNKSNYFVQIRTSPQVQRIRPIAWSQWSFSFRIQMLVTVNVIMQDPTIIG